MGARTMYVFNPSTDLRTVAVTIRRFGSYTVHAVFVQESDDLFCVVVNVYDERSARLGIAQPQYEFHYTPYMLGYTDVGARGGVMLEWTQADGSMSFMFPRLVLEDMNPAAVRESVTDYIIALLNLNDAQYTTTRSMQ